MKLIKSYNKPISIFVSIAFSVMLCFWANQTPAAVTAPAPEKGTAAAADDNPGDGTGFIEQEETAPSVKKGKKFPWLIVALVVVAGGAAVYFLVLKKKNYNLTVNVSEGVTGTPAAGTSSHKKGTTVSYNYSLQSGYNDLVVTLDGATIPASGTVTMNANHVLEAKATKFFTLTVTKGAHVTGTPNNGSYTYARGSTVNYNYEPASGYNTLEVKVDNVAVANAGTIIMDADHNLTVSASKTYTLTVSKGAHVNGTPNSGTFTYTGGTIVNYSYTPASGYTAVEVKVDNVVKASSGTITMNAAHTLTVSASKTYTLTVSKGAHVTGTPNSGAHSYNSGTNVSYSYSPESGYSNLEVKLDNVVVAATGTVTMDTNHTLEANLKGATIIVNSTPAGGRIYMDKVDSGFTTPHTFFYESAVIMNVRVRASACGYQEYFTTATANIGQTVTVNATLKPGIAEDFGIPASSCWSPYYSGNWSTIGGHYRFQGSPAGGSPNVYLHSFSGDYKVTAEMNRIQGSTLANAIFLGTNSSQTSAYGYYFAYYHDGHYGIWRFHPYNFITWSGTYTQIKYGTSGAIHAGLNQWNSLKIVKTGSNYTCYINNTVVHSFTDATYNPTYLLLTFGCGGVSTETRTDLVDLIPGSGAALLSGQPMNMAPANDGMNERRNPLTGQLED